MVLSSSFPKYKRRKLSEYVEDIKSDDQSSKYSALDLLTQVTETLEFPEDQLTTSAASSHDPYGMQFQNFEQLLKDELIYDKYFSDDAVRTIDTLMELLNTDLDHSSIMESVVKRKLLITEPCRSLWIDLALRSRSTKIVLKLASYLQLNFKTVLVTKILQQWDMPTAEMAAFVSELMSFGEAVSMRKIMAFAYMTGNAELFQKNAANNYWGMINFNDLIVVLSLQPLVSSNRIKKILMIIFSYIPTLQEFNERPPIKFVGTIFEKIIDKDDCQTLNFLFTRFKARCSQASFPVLLFRSDEVRSFFDRAIAKF